MQFEKVILIKPGELSLKGLNRRKFEIQLIKNILHVLKSHGNFKVIDSQSAFVVHACDPESSLTKASSLIRNVFGISKLAITSFCHKDLDTIKTCCVSVLHEHGLFNSFKIESKRADKTFFPNSKQLCPIIGELILDEFRNSKVDLHTPDVSLKIEVRSSGVYVYTSEILGAGGLPVGCGGSANVLLSGGIDSPVAAYMMAKRGMNLRCTHFASPPYTSNLAKTKVEKLVSILERYCNKIEFCCIEFTKIQEAIKNFCPPNLFTIIMRRFMFKISQDIALINGNNAIVTGESLGQVASQTLEAITCTNEVCRLPVFRPLIGMDKLEIIERARLIGSFETSILPYEDCCTIFTPKHPQTKPSLKAVLDAEAKLCGTITDSNNQLLPKAYRIMP